MRNGLPLHKLHQFKLAQPYGGILVHPWTPAATPATPAVSMAPVAAVPYPGAYRTAVPMLDRSTAVCVRDLVEAARRALAMACGLSSQLEVIPAAQTLPGLHTLHARGLAPMSYHVLTATGAAETLLHTGPTLPLVTLLVACMSTTLELGGVIPDSLAQLRAATGAHAPGTDTPYAAVVLATDWWARRIMPPLVEALTLLQADLGPTGWQQIAMERRRLAERTAAAPSDHGYAPAAAEPGDHHRTGDGQGDGDGSDSGYT